MLAKNFPLYSVCTSHTIAHIHVHNTQQKLQYKLFMGFIFKDLANLFQLNLLTHEPQTSHSECKSINGQQSGAKLPNPQEHSPKRYFQNRHCFADSCLSRQCKSACQIELTLYVTLIVHYVCGMRMVQQQICKIISMKS